MSIQIKKDNLTYPYPFNACRDLLDMNEDELHIVAWADIKLKGQIQGVPFTLVSLEELKVEPSLRIKGQICQYSSLHATAGSQKHADLTADFTDGSLPKCWPMHEKTFRYMSSCKGWKHVGLSPTRKTIETSSIRNSKTGINILS